jgi:hypothetical protein
VRGWEIYFFFDFRFSVGSLRDGGAVDFCQGGLLLVDFFTFYFRYILVMLWRDEGMTGMVILLLSRSFCIFLGRFLLMSEIKGGILGAFYEGYTRRLNSITIRESKSCHAKERSSHSL